MGTDVAAPRPPSDAELLEAARRVAAILTERGMSLATAESCTGGLVGHVVTQVPGSSAFFRGGVVAYADDVKQRLLDVSPLLISTHGAVSAPVASAMADGARLRLGADASVAVTGIAGPDGGSAEKPVGLVFVAASGGRVRAPVERHVWPFDRDGNKRAAAAAALDLLARAISAEPLASAREDRG